MTTVSKKRFGASLNPVLGVEVFPEDKGKEEKKLLNLMVQNLEPGRFQPRKEFAPDALEELAASIKSQGILQPLIVRELNSDCYEIIAGERRWRAAQMAGLQQVPAIVSKITDEEALAFGLIENIQRKDLNPVEEAVALSRLIDEFGMTHEQVSKSVGKSRSAVTNTLRLLKLSEYVKQCLIEKKIEIGHAKTLVVLPDEQQDKMCKEILDNKYSARDAERLIRSAKQHGSSRAKHSHPNVESWKASIERMLAMAVQIKVDESGKGKVIISVKDAFQIEQIIDSLS